MNFFKRVKNYFLFFILITAYSNVHTFFTTKLSHKRVMTDFSPVLLQKYCTQQLLEKHQQEQNLFSDIAQKSHRAKPCTDINILLPYLRLQQRMNFSQIIPLFTNTNKHENGSYNNPGFISINKYGTIIPSVLLFTILHELRHVQQQKSLTNYFFSMTNFTNALEQDADHFAASCLKCPICLTINQLGSQQKKDENGYFCFQEYTPYIAHAQKYGKLCNAHKTYNELSIFKKLMNQNMEERICFDQQCGNLFDRIPNTIAHVPFFSYQKNLPKS